MVKIELVTFVNEELIKKAEKDCKDNALNYLF